MAEREPDVVNHSLSASQHAPIKKYFLEEAEMSQKLQEMGKLIYKCIRIINGPSGMLRTANQDFQIKLGDKINGNNGIINLDSFLEDLEKIQRNIYKGVEYISKIRKLKERVNEIIDGKIWDTKLGKLKAGDLKCPISLKEKVTRIAVSCSGGVLIGAAVTVGGILGLFFGSVIISVIALCGICSGIVALGAIGFGVGVGVAALGIWVYDAVKIGQIRNKSFIAFQALEQHIDETDLMPELDNLVRALEAHCNGIIDVMNLTSIALVDQTPNSSVLSQGGRYRISPVNTIPHTTERPARRVVRKDADQLLPELTDIYQSKMAELGENSPEMEEGTRHLVAMNVAVEMCRYKMKNEGSSKEEIGNFINQKLMPALIP